MLAHSVGSRDTMRLLAERLNELVYVLLLPGRSLRLRLGRSRVPFSRRATGLRGRRASALMAKAVDYSSETASRKRGLEFWRKRARGYTERGGLERRALPAGWPSFLFAQALLRYYSRKI